MSSGSPVLVENVVGLKNTLDYILARLGNFTGGGINELTGPVTAGPGAGSQATTITPTGVVAGAYGGATNVGAFIVGADGRLTAAVNVPIATSGITELTGDVTAGPGTGSQAATIADDAVTNAKLANMATQTFKGRNTAGTGDPEDLSIATAQTMLSITTELQLVKMRITAAARM